MSRTVSYEEVFDYVKSLGLELVSKEYKKYSGKLIIKCKNGHVFEKNLSNLKAYPFCGKCFKDLEREREYEEIKTLIESVGGKIISSSYKNSVEPLEFICACGRNYSMDSVKIKVSGGYCPLCRYERAADTRRYSYDEVLEVYENNGCILISKEYITGEKLEFICLCGKRHSKLFVEFINSPCCDECGHRRGGEKNSIKYEEIREFFTNNNCLLLTTRENYGGKNSTVEFVCTCGRKSKKGVKAYFRNPCCNECSKEMVVKKSATPYSLVKEFIEENNCLLLTDEKEYKSATKTWLKIKCNCGNIFETTFIYFKFENKRRCNACSLESVSGENSVWWTGGSSERDMAKSSSEYKEWRKKVFERDNYVCQCCGRKTSKLHAHHIENFATNPDKRTDVDNGITLCEDCHGFNKYGAFHWVYGSKNNTREQLDEYIERYRNGEFRVIQLANLIK